MVPEERDYAYLWDMLQSALAALSYLEGRSVQEAFQDEMRMAAFERKLEILGEAAKRGVRRHPGQSRDPCRPRPLTADQRRWRMGEAEDLNWAPLDCSAGKLRRISARWRRSSQPRVFAQRSPGRIIAPS
jgi:hypothetical protein